MFSVMRETSAWSRPPGREVGRGSVGSRARNAAGAARAGVVLGALRADHHRTRRIEDLLALLAAREIALHRNARAEFVAAQQRLERGVDLGQQVRLHLVAVIQRRLRRAPGHPGRPRLWDGPADCRSCPAPKPRPATAPPPRWPPGGRWPARSAATASRPGRSFTSTLALAGCCASRKTESLGNVRCTRACSTSASDITERSSSPSSARR